MQGWLRKAEMKGKKKKSKGLDRNKNTLNIFYFL